MVDKLLSAFVFLQLKFDYLRQINNLALFILRFVYLKLQKW